MQTRKWDGALASSSPNRTNDTHRISEQSKTPVQHAPNAFMVFCNHLWMGHFIAIHVISKGIFDDSTAVDPHRSFAVNHGCVNSGASRLPVAVTNRRSGKPYDTADVVGAMLEFGTRLPPLAACVGPAGP